MTSKIFIISCVFVVISCSSNYIGNGSSESGNLLSVEANSSQISHQNDDDVPAKKTNLNLADRVKWKKIIKWDDSCPNEDSDSVEYHGGLKFYELNSKKYLVEVKCSATNYPGYKLYFLYDENKVLATSNSLDFLFYRGKTNDLKEDPKNLTQDQLNKLSRRMPSKMFASEEKEIFSKTDFDKDSKSLLIYDAIDFPHNCGTLNRYDFVNNQAQLKEIRGNWLCYGEETNPLTWKLLDLKYLKKVSDKQ